MTTFFKQLFGKLTPLQVVARELAEAELAWLTAKTGYEFADAMVAYHEKRIARLRGDVLTLSKTESKS